LVELQNFQRTLLSESDFPVDIIPPWLSSETLAHTQYERCKTLIAGHRRAVENRPRRAAALLV
jgi:hypothetical protein